MIKSHWSRQISFNGIFYIQYSVNLEAYVFGDLGIKSGGIKQILKGRKNSNPVELGSYLCYYIINTYGFHHYKSGCSRKEEFMELLKGQKIKLETLTASSQIELHTAVRMRAGEADVTCFGVDDKGKLSDDRYFIFYNQTSSPEQEITMKQDNTGTVFSIDLKKLPSFIKKLVITVAAEEQTTMKDVESGQLSVGAAGQSLADFMFSGSQFQQEKALILCEIYEKDGSWRLSVVASGFNGGLSALLKHFGGEEISAHSESRPAPASVKPISLKKSGESHKISLQKNNKEIHVNLNWNTGKNKQSLFKSHSEGIDLDLACMYKLKTGEKGVIQAIGKRFGNAEQPPYIFLDQDDRTGVSQNGENMWFKKPELIDFAIVFAFIYEGVPNWRNTDASVVLKQYGSPDIEIHLDDCKSQDPFCVIASLAAKGDELEIKREERFFRSHQEVDWAYGFGFLWRYGSK